MSSCSEINQNMVWKLDFNVSFLLNKILLFMLVTDHSFLQRCLSVLWMVGCLLLSMSMRRCPGLVHPGQQRQVCSISSCQKLVPVLRFWPLGLCVRCGVNLRPCENMNNSGSDPRNVVNSLHGRVPHSLKPGPMYSSRVIDSCYSRNRQTFVVRDCF